MNGRSLRVLLAIMFAVGFSFLISQDATAANFSAQIVGSSTINASSTGNQLSVMVTDSDSTANITVVNVTLSGFTFVAGSNTTGASNTNFSNTSTNLTWSNVTNEGFVAALGDPQYFNFSANAPNSPGIYTFTVTVTDTGGASNSTTINYSVVDNPSYLITFDILSPANMSQSTNFIQNLSYLVKITNQESLQEIYNLSVVNCSNTSQAGAGILNMSSATINSGQSIAVQLNVLSSTSGYYSSCVMARHWNGTVDTYNVTSAQNNIILNSGFYPDLTVPAVYWTSSGGQNPYAGGNITANATLNNSGHFNFSGDLVVSLLWDGLTINSTTVANTSLGNGTTVNVNFNSVTGILDGLRNLTVRIDSSGVVQESNENNNDNTTQILVGYNITVLNVTGQSGVNAAGNKNVIINVSVRYANGSYATGLGSGNFTVFDFYSGSSINSSAPTGFDSSMNSIGVYLLNMTSCSPVNNSASTYPGIHNLTITASNGAYSGNSTGSPYYYLMVPNLQVTLSAASTTMSESTTKTITVNVTNSGTDSIYNVTLTISGDSYSTRSTPSCSTKTLGNNYVSAGESFTCTFILTAPDVSEDTSTTFTAKATGNYNYSGYVVTYYKFGLDFTVLINVVSETTGDTGTGGTRSCTSDSSCSANESCVSRVCTAISCPNGVIDDHVCLTVSYKINITDYESSVSSFTGKDVSTKVTVKNSGSVTFTAKLEVTLSSVTATVSPASYSLGGGESYQFTVNFTVPNSTKIGNFSGTYKAYVSTSTSSYDKKTFSFAVMPGEETKSAINSSYQELALLLTNFTSQLSQLKASGLYNQSVISSLEELVNSANSTLQQIKSAIEADNYIGANTLVSQLNSSMENIETEIGNAQAQKSGGGLLAFPEQYGMWFWAAIIVIVVFVVGFFLYMFYPSSPHQGYQPDKGFVHPEAGKGGLGTKLKKMFKRKKKEPSATPASITSISSFAESMAEPEREGRFESFHYSEGYKKEKSYTYDYGEGGKIKGFFSKLRKKKEKVPQMHLDQFAQSAVTEQAGQDEQK